MIALIQRVSRAQVRVGNDTVSRIGPGILLLVGIGREDGPGDVEYIARKTVNLRIFGDARGHLNRSLLEIDGEVLIVSQFTLLADTKKGRRPSFSGAAPPEIAQTLYRQTIEAFSGAGARVREGSFGAMMQVSLTNDGPVTIIIDSKMRNPVRG
jgi:D-tyrosyl-tRNA(Tyr) deacylase